MPEYGIPDVLDVSVVSAPRVKTQSLLLVQKRLEQAHVCEAWISVYHALEANVFVQPYTPVDLVLFVYGELLAEQVVALLVDLIVAFFARARIYWTELAVPDLSHVRAGISGILREEKYSPELFFLA